MWGLVSGCSDVLDKPGLTCGVISKMFTSLGGSLLASGNSLWSWEILMAPGKFFKSSGKSLRAPGILYEPQKISEGPRELVSLGSISEGPRG